MAGFVVAITGVVLYCVITFAGNITTDLADILLRNALPAARGSLAVVGAGSLLWLIGSFMHLRGAMDAEDATGAGAP
ncbi:MAG: hypothetical protein IT383_01975 [Deltaproteobacteria bacterium]|nr:hypothetical protein [Deltaproteobacteria bacterium]